MVSVTVYGSCNSLPTQSLLILLEELSLKYTFEEIDTEAGEHKQGTYLQRNPFGTLPTVVYDDLVLFNVRSALRFIAANNTDDVNLVGDIYSEQWFESEPILSNDNLESLLDLFEDHLSEHAYLGGDEYSIADIIHIPYVYAIMKLGKKNQLKSRPHVYEWLKKIVLREPVSNVVRNKQIGN